MFRIRKIHDAVSPANKRAIAQIMGIISVQFPLATSKEIGKLPDQLQDPLRYRFRSILLVAEDRAEHIKGFALLLHAPDLGFCYLEFISVAPGMSGGGIGTVLYERVREEAIALGAKGLFMEVLPDEPHLSLQPALLPQNVARLRFYERYGARPILTTEFGKTRTSDDDLFLCIVLDPLGKPADLRRNYARQVIKAILERKYGSECSPEYIEEVLRTYKDDPIRLRELRYQRRMIKKAPPAPEKSRQIPIIVNAKHDIHHVKDRGYVEAPVRIPAILAELEKSGLFRRENPQVFAEKHIRAVHDADFVEWLRRVCQVLKPGKSIYPLVFPLRNAVRPPRDLEMRAGYYCLDTFTPLNRNAYLAARGAVDCAMTGAQFILAGERLAYALVRPPGHHAEKRVFGGFCYFNSAAIAANYLAKFGRVAILDVDFHHGNGTQDIFYNRADVYTVSIHGHPNFAFPYFSGFADEIGVGAGTGFNLNLPLPERINAERYRRALKKALARIRQSSPAYLVVSLGLDTAKNDPTGTWPLTGQDFQENGLMIGQLGLSTLVIQEGGYNHRTLGSNARHFFVGLWEGIHKKTSGYPVASMQRRG